MPRAAKRNAHSPVLNLAITPEQYDKAVQSASGACLIADAIKAQYPHLTFISVDMATIRATDAKKGDRYVYLTPPTAQHMLLAFDQGWPNPAEEVTVKGAVQILPVRRGGNPRQAPEARAARRAELEAKVQSGEPLTPAERGALTRLAKYPNRPSNPSKARVTRDKGKVTVRGGRPIPQGPAHPNLLRGLDRHFGAKLADPGTAFREAVDKAVTERLAGQAEAGPGAA